MDNIVFDKDKDFHNNSILNRNHKAVKTLPSVVTICLVACDLCTDEYIDTNLFIQKRCCCPCHSNNNEVEKNE